MTLQKEEKHDVYNLLSAMCSGTAGILLFSALAVTSCVPGFIGFPMILISALIVAGSSYSLLENIYKGQKKELCTLQI